MPRNKQGVWVTKEELEKEEQSNPSKNEGYLGVTFKENLTQNDYQKILIEQNQAIIQLLSIQVNNVVQGVFVGNVNKHYQKTIQDFTVN